MGIFATIGGWFGRRSRIDQALDLIEKGATPPGSDGVYAPGGVYWPGLQERDPKLFGRQKWITLDSLTINTTIVASALRAWIGLGSSVKWHAEKNPRGGKMAERMVDIVTEGLLENTNLSSPWPQITGLQLMSCFKGFAMHAFSTRRRKDGVVVFGDIQHRPQWTIRDWIKPSEDEPWTAVEQQTLAGNLYRINRGDLFYSCDNLLTSDPEGLGLLRHVVEAARTRQVYARLEGIGAQNDLNGMPSARAPLRELAADALKVKPSSTPAEIAAYVQAQTKFLTDLLEGHAVAPGRGTMMDSAVYTTEDQARTPSSVYKYAFDVIRSATNIAPVGNVIARLDREIARVMMAEFLLLGDSASSGNRALSQSKTDMFGMSINGANRRIGADATRDLSTTLTVRNGGDPETDTPILVPEPAATADVEAVCRSLLALSQAGLAPDDPARNVVRSRMDLPDEPERDPALLLAPRAPRGLPPNIVTKPPAGEPPVKPEPKPTEQADAADVNPAAKEPAA